MADPSGIGRETERISAFYDARDASERLDWTWGDPAYTAWMQDLEWKLLQVFRTLGVHLPTSDVLDVGAGGGYFSNRLLDYGARTATAVELLERRAQAARSRYAGLEVVQGNAADMPFPDDHFDVVTQFMCLSSIHDAAMRRAVGSEMRRVTRPGGIVLSFDVVPRPKLQRAGRRLRRLGDGPKELLELSREEFEQIVGAKLVAASFVGFPQEVAPVMRAVAPLARAVTMLFPLRVHLLMAARIH